MVILYQVISHYACAGVECENDIIINTAPIYNRLKGQNVNDIKKYYKVIYVEEF
jgi:hypothetical protein